MTRPINKVDLPGEAQHLRTLLLSARWRITWTKFFTALFAGAVGMGILLIAIASCQVLSGQILNIRLAATWLSVVVFFGAGGCAWLRRPSLEGVAACLDAKGSTCDRLVTALELLKIKSPSSLEVLALKECSDFIRKFHVPPIQIPRRQWLVLLVPFCCVCLLFLYANLRTPVPVDRAESALLINSRAALLTVAAALESDGTKTGEWDGLVLELRNAGDRLSADRTEDARKAALKEISTLQEKLESMLRQQKAGITAQELSRLAEALRMREGGEEAADLLESGELEALSRHLEEMLAKLHATGQTDNALEELAKSVQANAGKLTREQKGQLDAQMAEAASNAGQGGRNARDARLQAAMEQLAKALQNSGQSSGNEHGGGTSARSMTLEEILEALERIKSGVRSGNPQEMETFAFSGNASSGKSGSEHSPGQEDTPGAGATESSARGGAPDGVGGTHPVAEGKAQRLSGIPGEGETTREMLRAVGRHENAVGGYSEIFQAAAPAAEEAILRENIPLGSRMLVRRYFENIRPAD